MTTARRRRIAGRLALAVIACVLAAVGPARAALTPIDEFGGETFTDGRLGEFPSGAAVDADGNVWALDDQQHRIVKYTYNGDFIIAVGAPALTDPVGIATDDQGFVYVADRGGIGTIVKLDNGGTVVDRFGTAAGDGDIDPRDVAVRPNDGTIYVSEPGGVARFTRSGGPLSTLPIGSGSGIAATRTSIFVLGDQVSRFTLKGKASGAPFGGAPFFTGGATGIAVSPDGSRVYVSYNGDGAVGVYDARTGAFMERFGELPSLTAPGGVAADCRGNVYVTDTRASTAPPPPNQGRVVKYGDPAAPPPPCGPKPPLPTSGFEVQTDDIEVTQAVQYDDPFLQARNTDGFQSPIPGYGNRFHRREVGLAAGKTTVVRVYASLRSGPPAGLGNVPATLRVSRVEGGVIRDLGTLDPIASPALLRVGTGLVDRARRSDPAGAYTFVLPPDWTTGTLSMEARVNPGHVGCQTRSCEQRGAFVLGHIPFSPVRTVQIAPLGLYDSAQEPAVLVDPQTAFDAARTVLPLPLDVPPYLGLMDVGVTIRTIEIRVESCTLFIFCDTEVHQETNEDRGARLAAIVDSWNLARGNGSRLRVPLGFLDKRTAGGRVRSQTVGNWWSGPAPKGVIVGNSPLRTVTHELTHGLRFLHPVGCDAGFTEAYPFDRGLLGPAIGIDTRAGSGGGRGPFRIIAAGARGQPDEYFDYMSYCAQSENDVWISPFNWQRILRLFPPAGGPAPPADPPALKAGAVAGAAASDALAVRATVLADGSVIVTNVAPANLASTTREGRGGEPTAYNLTARSADTTLSTVQMTGVAAGEGGGMVLDGVVPAAGVTAIFVGKDGSPAARRLKSAHAPTARLLTPRAGARLRGRTTAISWTAADADPGSTLSTDVEYSADGGRSWRPLSVDTPASRVTVPTGMLTASSNARIRVRVNDGFNETSALSGRFTAPGGPPVPRIGFPGPGARVRADGSLVAIGGAWSSDGVRKLTGRALRWSIGRRSLGSGTSVRINGLPAGRQTLVLTARDGDRVARRAVTIRVDPVAPALRLFKLPTRVSVGARTLTIRVASNVPATLTLGGKRFTVGRATRSVRISIAPGDGELKLVATLNAGRLRTSTTVLVPRV